MTEYVVPPIIQNWITALQDATSPLHIRENYARMLQNVQEACMVELGKFQASQNNMTAKKKRK